MLLCLYDYTKPNPKTSFFNANDSFIYYSLNKKKKKQKKKEKKSKMNQCIQGGVSGTVFVTMQWLPLLVAASLGGVSWVTGSVFFFVIGTWLWLSSYLLYPLQTYFNTLRASVMCQTGQSMYSFPSIEMFYIASVVTIVVFYAIAYKGRPGWFSWACLFFLFAIPAVVLCFFQLNVWWEVLWSALAAVVLNVAFMSAIYIFVSPNVPYLEVILPLGYNDDHGWFTIPGTEAAMQRERLRIHETFDHKAGRFWKPLHEV